MTLEYLPFPDDLAGLPAIHDNTPFEGSGFFLPDLDPPLL
jgi:hypothetical protein